MREILGEFPIKIIIPDNTQLNWYLIQIPGTQPDPTQNIFSIPEPDPKLKNPSDPGYIPALYCQKAASVAFFFCLKLINFTHC